MYADAPFGDLSRFLRKEGCPMPEIHVKAIATQISSALDFMHSLKLVHRDVVPENILVFQKDFSVVKLSDFGSTVPIHTLLTKTSYENSSTNNGGDDLCDGDDIGNNSNNSRSRSRSNSVTIGTVEGNKYLPPEICGILPQEKYHCYPSIDVWQVNIYYYIYFTFQIE